MSKGELYEDREQTLVKHFILQKYLERFAHIVGTYWDNPDLRGLLFWTVECPVGKV